MKKCENTTIYCNYEQEINTNFLAVLGATFVGKSSFMAMSSQVRFLSQEKLPIIYANIRV
ncbi:hypothetical protein [Flavobacterium sp. 25HG05S-40]|uniref:hypothetical protein n=1 Tax=Flavobacterium sp. 25HG05S-40 TaxID=3458682 RepID=UPI004044FAFD